MMIIQYNNDIWFAETYRLHGNSLKLTYLILCGKAFLYAILLCTLMLTAKVGLCITSRVILFPTTSIRQNLLSGMGCSPYALQSYVLPCLKNHKCWIFYYCSSTSQTKSVLTQQFLLEIFFKRIEKEEQLCTTYPESKKKEISYISYFSISTEKRHMPAVKVMNRGLRRYVQWMG